jgi:hypothetical protein
MQSVSGEIAILEEIEITEPDQVLAVPQIVIFN